MAILKIRRMGDPVLAQIAAPVADLGDPAIQALVGDMVETMIDANGAGLAAPQIGVPLRVVVFQAPATRSPPELEGEDEAFDHSAPLTVLVNPVITRLDEGEEEGWEGCLSVPGLRGLVPRATYIRYSGFALSGEPIEREARGFHARVVQHECDHLEGVLYPQRMRDMRDLIFESEWRHRLARARDEGEHR